MALPGVPVVAVASAVAYGLMLRWAPETLYANPGLQRLLATAMVMNVGLALFNMLPVPPLDGSRGVEGLMPYRLQASWERVVRFGPLLLLAVVLLGSRLIAGPVSAVTGT